MSPAVLERPSERPECDVCIAAADYEYDGESLLKADGGSYRWVCDHHYRLLSRSVDRDPAHWHKIGAAS
jgi:hypothetical protein